MCVDDTDSKLDDGILELTGAASRSEGDLVGVGTITGRGGVRGGTALEDGHAGVLVPPVA